MISEFMGRAAAPSRLALMRDIIAASGGSPEAGELSSRMPLFLPVARLEDGRPIGILQWPTPLEDTPMPVVVQDATGGVDFVAASVDDWLHRELVVREAVGPLDPDWIDRANADATLYSLGTRAITGLPVAAYLLLKVGPTPELLEDLSRRHLDKGDEMAALVTADRSCRGVPGFARPHGFRALLLARLRRLDEARDAARAAFLEPLWTLGLPFEPVARLSGWTGAIDGAPFHRMAAKPGKLPLDRAAYLLNAVWIDGLTAGAPMWATHREAVAALYREGGLPEIAELVLA